MLPTTLAQLLPAETSEPNMPLTLLVHALTSPWIILSAALAIVCFASVRRGAKKWIPICSGLAVLALYVVQLVARAQAVLTILGDTGMGHPEDLANATLRFLAVASVGPIVALPAVFGLSRALLSERASRSALAGSLLLTVLLAAGRTTGHVDAKLSESLADGRGYYEEQLWDLQVVAYVEELRANGVEIETTDVAFETFDIPREVRDDLFRPTFFEEHPPPSVLRGLMKNTFFEDGAAYRERVDAEVESRYHAACAAEGKRLAQERLQRKD